MLQCVAHPNEKEAFICEYYLQFSNELEVLEVFFTLLIVEPLYLP